MRWGVLLRCMHLLPNSSLVVELTLWEQRKIYLSSRIIWEGTDVRIFFQFSYNLEIQPLTCPIPASISMQGVWERLIGTLKRISNPMLLQRQGGGGTNTWGTNHSYVWNKCHCHDQQQTTCGCVMRPGLVAYAYSIHVTYHEDCQSISTLQQQVRTKIFLE